MFINQSADINNVNRSESSREEIDLTKNHSWAMFITLLITFQCGFH